MLKDFQFLALTSEQRTSRVPVDASPFSQGGVLKDAEGVKFSSYGTAEVEKAERLKKAEELEKVLPVVVDEALQLDSKDGCSVWLGDWNCGTLYTVLLCHFEKDMTRAADNVSVD